LKKAELTLELPQYQAQGAPPCASYEEINHALQIYTLARYFCLQGRLCGVILSVAFLCESSPETQQKSFTRAVLSTHALKKCRMN
jgi:hypothetical protein